MRRDGEKGGGGLYTYVSWWDSWVWLRGCAHVIPWVALARRGVTLDPGSWALVGIAE